jgi:hypothetical protein
LKPFPERRDEELVELKCRECGKAFKAIDPNKELCGRCEAIRKGLIECPWCGLWWRPTERYQPCPRCGVFAWFTISFKDGEEKVAWFTFKDAEEKG